MPPREPTYLDKYFGPPTPEDEGFELPKRGTINFTGAGVTATDNPTDNRTDVYIPGGSFSVSGSGFVHVTGGVVDGAARAVDVSTGDVTGTLPIGRGGTGLTAPGSANNILYSTGAAFAMGLLVNAMVDPAAAIAGTKISPDFGAQTVKTTGVVRGGSYDFGSGTPTITSGAGAPSSTPADGSLYLRTNGTSTTTAYVRASGAWSALGTGGGGSASSGYDTADHGGGGQEVLSLTGSSGVVTVRGTAAIAFGSSPATGGNIRLPKSDDGSGGVWARNVAGTSNYRLVGPKTNATGDGGAQQDAWVVGDAANGPKVEIDGLVDDNGDRVIVFLFGGTSIAFPFAVTPTGISCGPGTTNGTPIIFGAVPSTIGLISFSNAGSVDPFTHPLIAMRNLANSGDRAILAAYEDSSPLAGITIGDDTWDQIAANVKTGGTFLVNENLTTLVASFALAEVKLPVLAGSGTRMVVTDATGVLSTQTIPAGGGGGAPAGADRSIQFNNTGAFAGAVGVSFTTTGLLAITGSAAITTGSTPATSGAHRLTNGNAIRWRNGGNTGDVSGVVVDSANNIVLGGSGTNGAFLDGVNGASLRVNGTTLLAALPGNITATVHLELGANYISFGSSATSAYLRFPSSSATLPIAVRNAANTADITPLLVDGSNNVFLGFAPVGASTVVIGASAKIRVGSFDQLTCDGSSVNLSPGGNVALSATSSSVLVFPPLQLSNASGVTRPGFGVMIWSDANRPAFWGSNTPAAPGAVGAHIILDSVRPQIDAGNSVHRLMVDYYDPVGALQHGWVDLYIA